MSKYDAGKVDLTNPNSSWTKLISLVRPGSKVLEFGCSSGYVSRVLREERDCRVVGLELAPEAAARARAYCEEVLVGDVETMDWPGLLGGRRFDVALYGDFLEHLRAPDVVLRKTLSFLEEEGYILISVPNVAHAAVRLELLQGSFRYEDLGLLDDTHLRFFTWETILALLQDAGFRVDHSDATTYDLPEDLIEEHLARVGLSYTAGLRREFAKENARAYQYVLRARRRGKADDPVPVPPPPKPILEAEDRWHRSQERILHLEGDARELTERVRELETESHAKQQWILKLEADIAILKGHAEDQPR